MPTPSIPAFNGQVKTPWRGGYTAVNQLTEYRPECREQMAGCRYRLMWRGEDGLPPFQFWRPFSMTLVQEWGLFVSPTATDPVVNLTPQIAELNYAHGGDLTSVSFPGGALADDIPPGTYYMKIRADGLWYLWEPVVIVCGAKGGNQIPSPPFAGGIFSAENDGAIWHVGLGKDLQGVVSVPGNPGPEYEIEGNLIANTGDGLLYEFTGGVWDPRTPASSGGWFDEATETWYTYSSGWVVAPGEPITMGVDGACWSAQVAISLDLSYVECPSNQAGVVVIVQGMSGGELTISIPGSSPVVADANGSYQIIGTIDVGTVLTLSADTHFDGCVTGVEVTCSTPVEHCYYRLTWTNCGNVGNTLMEDFTNEILLNTFTYPVKANPETVTEVKERADGSRQVLSRRRETTWTIEMGLVPWYIADALADLSMYDEVKLYPAGSSVADQLSDVRVLVEHAEDFGDCLAFVTITFQIDAATVACCDEYTPPCRESCHNVVGFTDTETPEPGELYAVVNSSEVTHYEGPGYDTPDPCDSGVVNLVDAGTLLESFYFDLNALAWVQVANVVLVTPATVDDVCELNIIAVIMPGYRGRLQYLVGSDWFDYPGYDLSASEWAENDLSVPVPDDALADHTVRIEVYSDECIVGYSLETDFTCP